MTDVVHELRDKAPLAEDCCARLDAKDARIVSLERQRAAQRGRLAAAEADGRLAADSYGRCRERFAAAERVVEAARTLYKATPCELDGFTCIKESHDTGDPVDLFDDLSIALAAFDGSEKAYSSNADPAAADLRITASAQSPEVQGRDSSDLNTAKQEGK